MRGPGTCILNSTPGILSSMVLKRHFVNTAIYSSCERSIMLSLLYQWFSTLAIYQNSMESF